jgi:hypothetical protein
MCWVQEFDVNMWSTEQKLSQVPFMPLIVYSQEIVESVHFSYKASLTIMHISPIFHKWPSHGIVTVKPDMEEMSLSNSG